MDVLPPNTIEEPVYIGFKRLPVFFVDRLPPDYECHPDKGIAYYYCCSKSCDFVWAAQWTPTPRRKLAHKSFSLEAYKHLAIPKICPSCQETIRQADEARARLYTTRMEQDELRKREKEEQEKQDTRFTTERKLMSFREYVEAKKKAEQQEALRKHQAKLTVEKTVAAFDFDSARERARQERQTGSVAERMMSQIKSLNSARETAIAPPSFDDVPLSLPPDREDDFVSKDPSWDVVDDDDANEGWTVINHFGSAAIEHRDAHVDCPTVRP